MSTGPARDVERHRSVRNVLLVTLALNLLVAASKGIYGWLSGSLAISSDAVHSLVDSASNVIGLVVVWYASAPPDPEHPYGHRKAEVIAAAGIGVAVGFAAFRFAWEAIDSLIHGGEPLRTGAVGFVIIVGTWLVNVFVALYEARRARELDSAYLAADAAHTASDVLVTGMVLLSYTAAYFGVTWADPIGALAVVVVIGRVAWQILGRNIAVLADRVAVDAAEVRALVLSIKGICGCHRVRSRGPQGAVVVDLHILVEGGMTVRAAHILAHQAEDAIRRRWPEIVDVTVHMEPEEDGPEGL